MPAHGAVLLGTHALRRFNVTFDYRNERIVLESNGHFVEPFEQHSSAWAGRPGFDSQPL